jgi:hypothetical protein
MAMIEQGNDRRGTLRKDIWSYLSREFPKVIDYRDFLLALQTLETNGRVTNTNGYYRVHETVYNEVKEQCTT